ncbi:MAG: hypothetical protein FD174_352 [Geobacteraceae bacterium]|nr:MAG: hypothetical protein FD174_352 [Geobacteraceae bacterium]
MKIKILLGMLFSLAAMTLSGCGGGGGAAPAAPTIVSGVAAKGQFVNGTVQIFAIDSATGDKEATPRRTVTLDPLAPGVYTADISPYTGPVLVEVAGTYKDEATGTEVATTAPLRAAIANASGTVTANVTPLTELAVRNAKKTSGALTAVSINAANANIASLFKVGNITTTKPVDAASAAAATASLVEKEHALVLATVSQLVKNSGNSLDKVLTDLTTDISVSGTTITMADKSIAIFKVALFDFMTGANNKTLITDPNATPVNIGTFKLAHLKIITQGTLPAGAAIGGIDFSFNLPAGVTVSADATTKLVSPGIVVGSGLAAVTGTTSISLATLNGSALRVVLANAQGFGVGEFVNIGCDIPAGTTVPTKATFDTALSLATITVTDLAGATIPGITVTTSTVDIF